jgi:hypothetical protein
VRRAYDGCSLICAPGADHLQREIYEHHDQFDNKLGDIYSSNLSDFVRRRLDLSHSLQGCATLYLQTDIRRDAK